MIRSEKWRPFVAFCVAAVFGAVMFFTCLVNNTAPAGFHPDEPSKVEQISGDQTRNFNHPALLLETAALIHRFDPQGPAIAAGRLASALFAGVAVSLLAMVGYLTCRWPGLLITGAVLAVSPSLTLYGHYFKEDTAFICGISTVLVAVIYLRKTEGTRRKLLWFSIVGLACGFAASAKYVGLVLIPLAVALAWLPGGIRHKKWVIAAGTLLLCLCAIAVFVALNARAFSSIEPPFISAGTKLHLLAVVEEGLSGQREMGMSVPNTFVLRASLQEMSVFLLIVGVIGILGTLKLGINDELRTVWIFMVFLLLSLSFTRLPFHRYALPVVTLGSVLCALHFARFASTNWTARSRMTAAVVALVVFGLVARDGYRTYQLLASFQNDSRLALRRWLLANAPPQSRILADSYAGLTTHIEDGPALPRTMKITSSLFAADAVENLDSAGEHFDFIVVAAPSYERLFDSDMRAWPGLERQLESRRQFYARLFTEEAVWEYIPSPKSYAYVDPELHVFRIRKGS